MRPDPKPQEHETSGVELEKAQENAADEREEDGYQ
jgi:hypothetical protein